MISPDSVTKELIRESFEFKIDAMHGSQIILHRFGRISLSQIKKKSRKNIYSSNILENQLNYTDEAWKFAKRTQQWKDFSILEKISSSFRFENCSYIFICFIFNLFNILYKPLFVKH